MGLYKKIVGLSLILLIFLNFVSAVAYDIDADLDVNKFASSDYLELTKSAVGEGMRTTAINTDFILAVLVIGTLGAVIIGGVIFAVKKRR